MSKSNAERIREQRIKENEDFARQLGIGSISDVRDLLGPKNTDSVDATQKNAKKAKSTVTVTKGNQRTSERLLSKQKSLEESRIAASKNCKYVFCENDPDARKLVFPNRRALLIHNASNKCVMNSRIVAQAFEDTSMLTVFSRNVYRIQDKNFLELDSRHRASLVTESKMESYLDEGVPNHSCFDNSNQLELDLDVVNNMELVEVGDVLVKLEGTIGQNNISNFYNALQLKVFDLIFGKDSIKCSSLENFIDFVRKDRGDNVNESDLICAEIYTVLTEVRSRELANRLLRIIHRVKGPQWKIPRTYNVLSRVVIAEVENIYKFKTLFVPYNDNWGITGNNFPKITIYYRSPIEILSYL